MDTQGVKLVNVRLCKYNNNREPDFNRYTRFGSVTEAQTIYQHQLHTEPGPDTRTEGVTLWTHSPATTRDGGYSQREPAAPRTQPSNHPKRRLHTEVTSSPQITTRGTTAHRDRLQVTGTHPSQKALYLLRPDSSQN
ncbi:basic 7S globulin-like [Dorcoceras hygrometricum]|uniref:Basic 7S globulin-like n=1 Tax=Dorcoceras hygrometricum TaxID=472368 RepID=A0A2Z7A5K1_9LAMI|nr:basic 7S globulin-like [Dorcoceras hygrometricum]